MLQTAVKTKNSNLIVKKLHLKFIKTCLKTPNYAALIRAKQVFQIYSNFPDAKYSTLHKPAAALINAFIQHKDCESGSQVISYLTRLEKPNIKIATLLIRALFIPGNLHVKRIQDIVAGYQPDVPMLLTLVYGYSTLGIFDKAMEYLNLLRNQDTTGHEKNINNALIHFYTKSGDLKSCFGLLNKMEKIPIELATMLLMCAGNSKLPSNVQLVFDYLISLNLAQVAIFSATISAFEYNADYDNAKLIFRSMLEFNIEPDLYTYNVMILISIKTNDPEQVFSTNLGIKFVLSNDSRRN